MVRRDEWVQFRRRTRAGRRSPTIESCWTAPREDGDHDVFVRGRGLSGVGAIPTRIRVGGRQARHVDASDDTLVTGVVADGEPGEPVEVDLGPVGTVTGTLGAAP